MTFDYSGNVNVNNNLIVNGNIAIGTATPNEKLTINGSSRIAVLNTTTSTNSSCMGFRNTDDSKVCNKGVDGGGLCDFERGVLLMGLWTINSIVFTTGTTNTGKMRISATGNVGINISTPTNIFQVGDGQRLRISNGATDLTILGTKEGDNINNTRIMIYGKD